MDTMAINSAEIITYYDHTASEYAEQYLHELVNKPLDRYILHIFANLVKDGDPVYDVGCGPGHIAGHLAEYGVNAVGIDLSTGMVDEAKRHFPALEFSVGNMLELPVSDNHLSGIAAFYSIVHLEPVQIPLLAKEFYRTVKSNGYILLAFHIGKQEIVSVRKNIGNNEIAAAYVFHDYEYVIRCLKDGGFELVEAFIRYPYRGVEYPSRRAYILAKKL
jgi:ubiquinone/menaquinone biosynthesis C-methylase UbiE